MALALCGIAPAVQARIVAEISQRQPRFAILNLPDSTYLQMEVDDLSGTEVPKIDSVKVEYSGQIVEANSLALATANLRVWWSFRQVAAATPAVRVAQITRALPESKNAPAWGSSSVRALRIETLFCNQSGWTESVKVVAPPHVHNTGVAQRMMCARDYMCIAEDSIQRRNRLVSEFAAAWKTARFGAILDPSQILTLVYVSPWNQTSGMEDLSGIVAPMAGDRANWIDVRTQRFDVRAILPTMESIKAPAAVYDLPTGFVRYIYNRIASPELKILETSEAKQVDSVLKIGPTLRVEGSSRPYECDLPQIDSTMDDNSWLVLASSGDDTDVRKSMAPAIRGCGLIGRTSAWKVVGDTVWLEFTPFRIDELVALVQSTSVSPRPAGSGLSTARVSGTERGVSIDLPAPADVSITNLAGREVASSRRLAAGRHELSIGSTRGVVLVRIGGSGQAKTISVVR